MNGYVKIGTQLETKEFDAQIDYIEGQLQDIESKLKQADMGFEVGDTAKLEAQYEKLSGQLTTIKNKQMEATKLDFSNVQKSIDGVGERVGKVIKNLGRWVLAVFAIRSGYLLIRKAMSTLQSTNEQIKTDMDYMNFALGKALQPVVEWLIRAAYQILGVINAVSIKMFGFNLFANASADAFAKTNKQAKELKKTTAGFDEMNILSDSSGGAGITTPNVDLSSLEAPIPGWLQFIIDNGPQIIAILGGIGGAIMAMKIVDFAKGLGLVKTNLSLIQGLGIGLIIAGVLLAIQGIVAYIKDPSWHNFLTILQGVALVIAGIALLMGGWVIALIAVGAAIVAYLIQNFDKVRQLLMAVGGWMYNYVVKPIVDFSVTLWDKFIDGGKAAFNVVAWLFDSIGGVIGKVLSTIANMISKLFNVGGKIFDGITEGLGIMIKTVLNGLIAGINFIIGEPFRTVNKLLNAVRKTSFLGISPFKDLWSENPLPVPKINYLKTGGIINQPGRGVPLGMNARGGEAGREGVIPLTDSQAMQELGSSIGRYITINATIENNMNGRTISRVLETINAENSFIKNG